jgi:excisionase family DNA binding protein
MTPNRHTIFYSTAELAEMLGLSAVTLEKWRTSRVGPPFLRLGRCVRYRREDVDAWLVARLQSNSEGAQP